MIQIDLSNKVPIFKQIVEGFKDKILRGDIPPHSMLPSIRHLSTLLVVNPNTIKKAYMILEQEGYIYQVQGRGSFANELENRQLLIQKNEIQSFIFQAVEKAKTNRLSSDYLIKLIQEFYDEE